MRGARPIGGAAGGLLPAADGRAHVVQVANFVSPTSGGIRTTLRHLREGYVAAGHRTTLVIPGPHDEVRSSGAQTVVQLRAPRLPFSGGYRMLVDVDRVRRLLAELRPDVLEVSDRFSLRGLGDWGRANGVRTTVIVHERLDRLAPLHLPFPFRVAPAARRDNRTLARRFDTVVCPSRWAAEEFSLAGARNVEVVGWGVDVDTFSPAAADPDLRGRLLDGRSVLVALVCRLSPDKRTESVIDGVRLLLDDGIDVRLVVAGSGSSERGLRRRAAGLGVTFLGHVRDRRRVAAVLASSDVAVCPGPVETFGLAALEALACGTPVVSAATGAIAARLGRDHGATAYNHPATMAAAIGRVLALGPDARTAARDAAVGHRWESAVARMLAIHGLRAQAADDASGDRRGSLVHLGA